MTPATSSTATPTSAPPDEPPPDAPAGWPLAVARDGPRRGPVWLAWRRPGQQQIWFGAAAGALLVIAGVHVLPDAWSQACEAGIWPRPAAAAAPRSRWLAWPRGCSCQRDTRYVDGTGAAALAVHRFLEGSALVLIGSATVVAALAVHAMGEGLAVSAPVRAPPCRRAATWLAAMCVSPVAGVLVTKAIPWEVR